MPGTDQDTDLSATLAAAFDEFEAFRQAACHWDDGDPDLYAAFMHTWTSSGWPAVRAYLDRPSLWPQPCPDDRSGSVTYDEDNGSDQLVT